MKNFYFFYFVVHKTHHVHRRYESKRQEIEAWLMRMENRAERMGQAASQADVLDFSVLEAQQKEQKVGDDDF